MPELPEVEFAARNLREWLVGRTLRAVWIDPHAGRIVRPISPRRFVAGLVGRRIERVARIGKNVLITLAGAKGPEGLLAHLGMTGKWLRRTREDPPRAPRVRLDLDDGSSVYYHDPRMFGRLRLVPNADFASVPEIAALGPDPLDPGVDPRWLAERFARSSRAVKVAMMDQALLPGVGNIYASEALFRARIDPRRLARDLTRAEITRLVRSTVSALRARVANQNDREIEYVEEPGAHNPFAVYARAGSPCPRCGTERIQRVVQAQRSTFFCPACQGPDAHKRARKRRRG